MRMHKRQGCACVSGLRLVGLRMYLMRRWLLPLGSFEKRCWSIMSIALSRLFRHARKLLSVKLLLEVSRRSWISWLEPFECTFCTFSFHSKRI